MSKAKVTTADSFENVDMMRLMMGLRACVDRWSGVALFICDCLKETQAPACSVGATGLLHFFQQRSKKSRAGISRGLTRIGADLRKGQPDGTDVWGSALLYWLFSCRSAQIRVYPRLHLRSVGKLLLLIKSDGPTDRSRLLPAAHCLLLSAFCLRSAPVTI